MKFKKGFTLAETLITLAIIGIVAGITIPTLVKNYQKKLYVTQLKKVYTELNDGFKLAMARSGTNKLSQSKLGKSGVTSEDGDKLVQNTGFMGEFSEIFKVAGTVDLKNDESNRFYTSIKYLNGNDSEIYSSTTNSGKCRKNCYPILLKNGATLRIYKRILKAGTNINSLEEFQKAYTTSSRFWKEVFDIIVDVNGTKGPNQYGRDVFEFYVDDYGDLYPYGGFNYAIFAGCSESEVRKRECTEHWSYDDGDGLGCSTTSTSAGDYCAARIIEEGWEMNY